MQEMQSVLNVLSLETLKKEHSYSWSNTVPGSVDSVGSGVQWSLNKKLPLEFWRQRKPEQTQMVRLKYYLSVSVDGEEAPVRASELITHMLSLLSLSTLIPYLVGFSWLISSAFFPCCMFLWYVLSESSLFFNHDSFFFCLRQFCRIF